MSDRAASHPGGTWGAYIDGIPTRKGITLTELAKRSGIARNTFYKWKKGMTGVTVDSVKRVAQAAGDDEQYALRAAGGALIDEDHDPQLAAIYAADITDDEKQELVEYVLEERRRAEDALQRNVRMMIRTRSGGQAAG